MSIQKAVWVRCDECGEAGFASHTATQARREARENGWVFRNGKDYCKSCAPTKRAPDACTCGLKIDPVGWNRHTKDCAAYRPRR
jgi:hypothetical protein